MTLRAWALLQCLTWFGGGWTEAGLRPVPSGAALTRFQTTAPTGRIVIKFSENSGVTVRGAGVSSQQAEIGQRINRLLARIAPGARVTRRFSQAPPVLDALREKAAARHPGTLPDLNRYALLTGITAGDREGLIAIVKELVQDPAVETAFLEPVVVPTGSGIGSLLPDSPAPAATTPDYSDSQGYRLSPPLGVGAVDLSGLPGADGAGVKVVDIEFAWYWNHEDLPAPFVEIGTPSPVAGYRNHGTMVAGIIRSGDNGFGMTGIAPACQMGGASVHELSVAEAIVAAAAVLEPGDVILIELHGAGPLAEGAGPSGYVPLEFWQDNFDVIQTATAAGIVVCEGAGNGYHSLDDPVYANLFDRNYRDSGAILCGASLGPSLAPAAFSNSGSRLDAHGWGSGVATTGGGSLQGPPLPEAEWYTGAFSGTSSASAIVAGAVASLQGTVKAAFDFPLDSRLMRSVLTQTGTPQNPGPNVGPRPDLSAAWALVSGGVGTVAGTVTESGSGMPIEGAAVTVLETGAVAATGTTGQFVLPLLSGNYTLRFTSFFHTTTDIPVTVGHNATTSQDAALTLRTAVNLIARARGQEGLALLPGVRVTELVHPIAGGITDVVGTAHLGPIPIGNTYHLLYDGLPGYGAAYREFTIVSEGTPPPSVDIVGYLPPTWEDFEGDGGGFMSVNSVWSYGTPQAGGPPGGFSGSKCWGVGMTGNYPDDTADTLYSPTFNFSAEAPPALYLSFHYWSETEADYDGVTLDVGVLSAFGLIWIPREPSHGYSHEFLAGLAIPGAEGFGASGWSGSTGGWRGVVFDLTDRIPYNFWVRFRFGSDSGKNGEGFWIDDFAWSTGVEVTGLPVLPPDPPAPRLSLTAFPNPTAGPATLVWRSTREGPVALTVHDVRGTVVNGLLRNQVLPRSGSVLWDASDRHGRRLPWGVYWVRLTQDHDSVVRRIVLRP